MVEKLNIISSRAVHIYVVNNKPEIKIEGQFTVAEILQLSKLLEQFVLAQRLVDESSIIQNDENTKQKKS